MNQNPAESWGTSRLTAGTSRFESHRWQGKRTLWINHAILLYLTSHLSHSDSAAVTHHLPLFSPFAVRPTPLYILSHFWEALGWILCALCILSSWICAKLEACVCLCRECTCRATVTALGDGFQYAQSFTMSECPQKPNQQSLSHSHGRFITPRQMMKYLHTQTINPECSCSSRLLFWVHTTENHPYIFS